MRLDEKIRKLFTAAPYRSAGNHTVRWLSQVLPAPAIKTLFPLNSVTLLREIDGPGFREIQKKYGVTKKTLHSPKYISVPLDWLDENVIRVKALRLDKSEKKAVLDIGCGVGYFLYICQRLGHRVTGLDLDGDPIFNEMTEYLKVDRRIWRIESFVPLPDFGTKFDIVTAHLICFDRTKEQQSWEVAEWDFFLKDLSRHLLPAAELYFDMNPRPDGSFLSPELRAYFQDSHRAVVSPDGRSVYIRMA